MKKYLNKQIDVWCDGACKGNPGPGGWGAYITVENQWSDKKKPDILEYKLYGGEKETTNNIMEMTAVIKAAEWIVLYHYNKDKVIFHVDSAYIINCYKEKWYAKWIQNNWMTSNNEPVKNKELWEKLIIIFEQPNFHFEKVKGHSGIKGNEIADELANEGVKDAK